MAALHEETLTVIAVAIGAIGYSGFALFESTPFGHHMPAQARLIFLSLLAIAIATFALRKRHANMASFICIAGIFLSIAVLVSSDQQSSLSQLFVVPILLSSVLLKRGLVITTAIAAISYIVAAAPLQSTQATVVSIILLVTLAALVSMRNIMTSLTWLNNAYHLASKNELMLRNQSVEMKRVVKRLDELANHLERANQQLAFERHAALEARLVKQQFAQTISHELRTPLNLVVAFSELMAQSPELYGAPMPARYLRDLAIIRRNATHLQSLVNDVLDLARIDAAQMGLVLEHTQPESIALDTERTIRSLIEAQKLWLKLVIEPGLPAIMIDATRIRQVLINLLSNALRFTPTGGITLRVSRDMASNQVVFAVTDTGIGIEPSDLPRLFHEFEQLDGSTRRKHGGTGLGLVISKRFVELHNGTIKVESTPGIGSTFSFALPIDRHTDVAQSTYLGEITDTRFTDSTSRRSILMVTPSGTPTTGLFARHLENCTVLHSATLEAGRTRAQAEQPHVVVIDVELFAGDYADLRALMHDWSLEHAVFVVCPLPGEDALRRELAIESFLTKPITRDALLSTLQKTRPDARRIMVVDDDHDFVQLIRRMLGSVSANYTLSYAHSGAEALAMIAVDQPDLVLMDLQMQDMTGAEVIARLKADAGMAHIPVVVVSALDAGATIIGDAPLLIAKPTPHATGDMLIWLNSALNVADRSNGGPRSAAEALKEVFSG